MKNGKKTQLSPFTLYRLADHTPVFEAVYRVYHQNGFLAMYREYPAEPTEILLCRQISQAQKEEYPNELCELIHNYPGAEPRTCGYFIPFQTVPSAEQALKAIEAEVNGMRLIQETLAQLGGG